MPEGANELKPDDGALSRAMPQIPGCEMLRFIGSGGMSRVYLAFQNALQREVAVKVLTNRIGETEALRFAQEAKLTSALDHPNIVKIFGYGSDEAGNLFLVMEFLQGKTLAVRFAEGAPMSVAEFRSLFLPALDALSYAHERGIIHRDLKPENMFLCIDDSGKPYIKILDFGIARVENSVQGLTKTGAMLGSPRYMSPEQCMGQKVDARSDLYSLACVMYQALTGEVPYLADSPMALMQMHYREPAPAAKDMARKWGIDAVLGSAVVAALAKNPAERPANAAAFATSLSNALTDLPSDLFLRSDTSKRRFALRAVAIGLFIGASIAAVVTYVVIQGEKRDFTIEASDRALSSYFDKISAAENLRENERYRDALIIYNEILSDPKKQNLKRTADAFGAASECCGRLARDNPAESAQFNQRCKEYADQALELYSHIHDRENSNLVLMCYSYRIQALTQMGKRDAAIDSAMKMLNFAQKAYPGGSNFKSVVFEASACNSLCDLGAHEQAEKFLSGRLADSIKYDFPVKFRLAILNGLCRVYLDARRTDKLSEVVDKIIRQISDNEKIESNLLQDTIGSNLLNGMRLLGKTRKYIEFVSQQIRQRAEILNYNSEGARTEAGLQLSLAEAYSELGEKQKRLSVLKHGYEYAVRSGVKSLQKNYLRTLLSLPNLPINEAEHYKKELSNIPD